MKGSVGYYSYYPNNSKAVELALNGEHHSNTEYFQKYVDYCKSIKYYPQNATTHKTFVHEYGHHVSNSLRWVNNNPSFQHEFLQSCINEYNSKTNSSISGYWEFGDIVSTYGASSELELFAEAFAEYFGGENPRAFATIFGEKLDKVLKGV